MSNTRGVATSASVPVESFIEIEALKLRIPRSDLTPLGLRRVFLRGLALAFQATKTRTVVRGLENIPSEGPLLILPNHVSNLDGPQMFANYPRQLEIVGPGDFKMIALKDLMLRAYGMTLIKRGFADSEGLKTLINHLKAGKSVLMFPTGGMWEKRSLVAKPGAAYLSQITGAKMIPVAIGGTYLKSDAAFLGFSRPKITITFGKPMPAVPRSKNRADRDELLEEAGRELMARIYDLMEPVDKALYDRWATEIYRLQLDFQSYNTGEKLAYDGPALPDMATLAEFIGKPNLFRPMWENAGLAIEPFRETRYFAPIEVKIAARLLRDTLTSGTYERYIPYRMGDEAQQQVIDALNALRAVADWAMDHEARMRLTPVVTNPVDQG